MRGEYPVSAASSSTNSVGHSQRAKLSARRLITTTADSQPRRMPGNTPHVVQVGGEQARRAQGGIAELGSPGRDRRPHAAGYSDGRSGSGSALSSVRFANCVTRSRPAHHGARVELVGSDGVTTGWRRGQGGPTAAWRHPWQQRRRRSPTPQVWRARSGDVAVTEAVLRFERLRRCRRRQDHRDGPQHQVPPRLSVSQCDAGT